MAYSTYRACICCGAARTNDGNLIKVMFGIEAILLIVWFYYFYKNIHYNNAFFASLALLAASLVQFYLLWKVDRVAAYCQIPIVLLIACVCYAAWKARSNNTNTAETRKTGGK